MLLLGLDLGTTNAKAAVYDLNGQLQAEASVGYPTFFPRPGWAEQHPSDWTRALTQAVRRVVGLLGERVHELAGVGLSVQGPGLVLADANGAPLIDTCPTWQDERCAANGRRLFEQVGQHWPGLGGPFTNFPARLAWTIENFPDAAKQARYALGVKDFVTLWLTGEAVTEPTSATGGAGWFQPVFDACGWPLDRLPRMVMPTDTAGRIRADLARDMALPKPLPLVLGLNDGAAATLATGALDPGEMVITLATNGVLRVVMDAIVSTELRLGHNLFNYPYLPPALWLAGGVTKAGASTLQWFADVIGSGIDALLADAEQSPPGSGGVIFLPYLMGRGGPRTDPSATGTFTGMTLASGRGDLTRAVLEGAAFALRDIQADVISFGYPARPLRLSGGGGRSPLWRQIIADALGQPVTYYVGESSLGAAIVASVGLGLHEDFAAAIPAMVRSDAQHEPIPAHVEQYNAVYAAFQRTRDTLFPSGKP